MRQTIAQLRIDNADAELERMGLVLKRTGRMRSLCKQADKQLLEYNSSGKGREKTISYSYYNHSKHQIKNIERQMRLGPPTCAARDTHLGPINEEPLIPGLTHFNLPSRVTLDLRKRVINWCEFHSSQFLPRTSHSGGKRDECQLGYRYDYETHKTYKLHDHIPRVFMDLLDATREEKVDYKPLCVIVNRYWDNGLDPDTDSLNVFSNRITIVNMGEQATMRFTSPSSSVYLIVQDGSVVCMEDEARTQWKHETLYMEGVEEKNPRLSITYRRILKPLDPQCE